MQAEAGSPDDPRWLDALIRRSPLLPDRSLREHWCRAAPWLDSEARYDLAATLLAAEQAGEALSAETR